MRKLVIYGGGLIAEVANFYFTNDSDYRVCAFTNAPQFISRDTFLGRPMVSFEEVHDLFPPSDYDIFIAIGYTKTNQIRQRRFLEAKRKGYVCATYISSKAIYYGTPVGENCFILEGNIIQPFVRIGNNVIIWSGNHIGHHSKIHDHCFISSQVVISGNCIIEDNCFLGVNSTIRDNVRIGKFSVIGAGATVMRDCGERSVVQAPNARYRVIQKDVL